MQLRGRDQEQYLVDHAPIIAMTCAGAAMKRQLLSTLLVDTVVMEEAGKVCYWCRIREFITEDSRNKNIPHDVSWS